MSLKYTHRAVVAVFLCLMLSAFTFSVASASSSDEDDLMAMLTKELGLSPDQSKQLKAEIDKFAKTLDGLKAAQEKEGADPTDLVHGAKKAQEEYLKAVKKILSPEQFNQYEALKEKTLKGMFRDLAEIRLMDVQTKIGLSDDQVTKMVPIIGDSLYEVITLAWKHAGERMGPVRKVRLVRDLKRIQKKTRDAASKILTPEQLQAWEKYRQEQP